MGTLSITRISTAITESSNTRFTIYLNKWRIIKHTHTAAAVHVRYDRPYENTRKFAKYKCVHINIDQSNWIVLFSTLYHYQFNLTMIIIMRVQVSLNDVTTCDLNVIVNNKQIKK